MIAAGIMEFQSTRPVWGATTEQELWERQAGVSIHAPRVGRDTAEAARKLPAGGFNPRAPCGARLVRGLHSDSRTRFQSTRPVWGATRANHPSSKHYCEFQSTRPVWGATLRGYRGDRACLVSIHAPRVGRDPCQSSEQ